MADYNVSHGELGIESIVTIKRFFGTNSPPLNKSQPQVARLVID